MFSTVNSVQEYTGYEVTLDLIKRAQGIVEIFIGKDEIDVENPSDLLLLDKMTAYQAVYMLENEDLVFKQIASPSLNLGGSIQSFDTKMMAPYMAPLAVIAANGLSFNKSRSYKTGRVFQWNTIPKWRQD
jgi:hypothetical protein